MRQRYPLLILIDAKQGYSEVTLYHNLLRYYIPKEQMSVMFRLDNKNNGEFNQFVRDKALNNSISNSTRLVIANRKKITKPILKSNWDPVSVLVLGNSRGSYTVAKEYVERFDLKIFWTAEDSIISRYTRHKDNTYTTGIQAIWAVAE